LRAGFDAARAGLVALRAARVFGRAVFRDEALRAGRDVRFRAPADFCELRRDFAWVVRPAFRVPAFALRFAITDVLSASSKYLRHP
jgi:hypothetical protein